MIREYKAAAVDCDVPGCGTTYFDSVENTPEAMEAFALRDGWRSFDTSTGKKFACPECVKTRHLGEIFGLSPAAHVGPLLDGEGNPLGDSVYDSTEPTVSGR